MNATEPRVLLGHDPSLGADGTDVMVTLWPDGTAEVATRRGHEERWVTWSPPTTLTHAGTHEPEAENTAPIPFALTEKAAGE